MTITFTGDTFTSTQRVRTNCHSFDLSLADGMGNIGWPLKSIAEVYGGKNVGKSTFCFSLMGILAKELQKNIVILDWEGQSRETIQGVLEGQEFFGNVKYILNQSDEDSADTVERFLNELWDANQNIGLIDSIGGYIPKAYSEGSISDSNMGVFARETGNMVNKTKQIVLQSSPFGSVFMTNHVHPTIGSMVQGQETGGGVKKKYLAHLRIDLKRAYIANSAVDFGDSWLMKGKIDSNRYGFSKREFYVFMVGGEGIHTGLTALWDCVIAGHAELSAKAIRDSVSVSMDGVSYGKLRTIIKARNEEPQMFNAFINTLKASQIDTESTEEPVEEEKPKRKKK